MGDLTKWLLACIAEDEAVARHKGADAMTGQRWKHAPENVYQEIQSEALDNCRHVLAVCKAHRAIVELHTRHWNGDCEVCFDRANTTLGDYIFEEWPCPTLRTLATIYAGRPGWREEWAS